MYASMQFDNGHEWLLEVNKVGDALGYIWKARPRGSIVCGEGVTKTLWAGVLAANAYVIQEEGL